MEKGCIWMRRCIVVGINPLHLTHTPLSISTVKSPPPSSSSSPSSTTPFTFFSTHQRRSLSATACAPSLHSIDDDISNPLISRAAEIEFSEGNSKTLLKGMRYHELEKWVQSHGYRPGQALMLWKRLYGNNIWAHCSDELEGINKDFKKMLSARAEFRALSLKEVRSASDGTKKILFTLDDGLVIETVIIPSDRGRNTVCVSSQVGCAMNCQFCYTGRMGLTRHLTAAEIVEQAVCARRMFTDEVGSITNVVFMGMGEPLQNIDNVVRAADIMVDEHGLQFSPRKVTVSTSGLVPQLKRFLHESTCALAVSLNATTDEVRNWIMPINRKYNLELLLGTLREELRHRHNYKVLFEYVMLAGVNDSMEDAKRLIDLVKDIPCKINLIQFNPYDGSLFKPTIDEKMIEFRNALAAGGCTVFLRMSRGDDQMAACGQLGKPGNFQAPLLRVPPQFEKVLNA
ncbi:Dual-specificity RNA methyltransferase RlmN [Bienertia sinuspersici]